MRSQSKSFTRPLSALSLAILAPAMMANAPATAAETPDPAFTTFVPSANPNKDGIDYSVWDEAMRNIVISMGASNRQTAGRAPDGFGTRRVYGHTSRYRLEGTRVMFSFFDDKVIDSFSEYRRDLEATASLIDIQALSRNQQLAYWINLHNVALIEQIASNWPVRQPRNIKIDGVAVDDAKILNVEGVPLSLRDIREKIVYANWKNPMVMYGFWRGEIGSPSLQREAFTGDNVAFLLERGARDFVNSLRGTQKLGSKLQISEFYAEAAPFFFNNFEQDVRAHIAQYAGEEVKQILAETTKTEASVSEYDIADLAGGSREPSFSYIETAEGTAQSTRIPRSMGALLAQRQKKIEKQIREGRTGTVTVIPIDLPGQEEDESEVE